MSRSERSASGREVRLARLTWEEVEADLSGGGTETVLIPVGTGSACSPRSFPRMVQVWRDIAGGATARDDQPPEREDHGGEGHQVRIRG